MILGTRTKLFVGISTVALIITAGLPDKGSTEVSLSSSEDSPASDDRPPEPPKPIAIEISESQIQAIRDRADLQTWGSDPFKKKSNEPRPEERDLAPVEEDVVAPTEPAPRLSAVTIRGEDRIAVIDRELVREGDSLSSKYRVVSIEEESVTLSRDDQTVTLILGGGK